MTYKCPNLGLKIRLTYLLTYLAITTCYRFWPQLICGAIHYDLLQLGTNFGYPAFLYSHQNVWPNADEAVLFCNFHRLAINWVGAIHTKDMTQTSKTLYFKTLHYVDVIVYTRCNSKVP